MKRGAVDFLQKPVNGEKLLQAVQTGIDRDVSNKLARADRLGIEQKLATLTAREKEVFRHIISGKPNKQVAADLGVVEKTIKVHRGRIMTKMKVQSLADLVRVSERVGIKPAADTSRTATPG